MLYQFVEVAAGKVGTADAALKQHIPRKHAVVCRAIVHQAARRVSRHMDGFQFRIAEGDDVSIVQISAQGHGASCSWKPNMRLCFGASSIQNSSAWLASAFRPNSFSMKGLPKIWSRCRWVFSRCFTFSPFLMMKFSRPAFLPHKTARVNDDRFIGFVPKHITVLREHIKFESLYFHIMYLDLSPTYTTFFVSKNSSSKNSFKSHNVVLFLTGMVSFPNSPPLRQISPLGNAFCCLEEMFLRIIFSRSVSGITARLTTKSNFPFSSSARA